MKTNSFDNLLEEAFSNSSVMDVRELRALYYGRLNIYVSFSDDGEYQTRGYIKGRLERPSGIVAHAVDVVVGRKVSSPLFYGNIFRRKSGSDFIEDIRTYNSANYEQDLEAFRAISYISDKTKEGAIEAASSPRMRNYFQRFWTLTRVAAGRGSSSDKIWSKIISDIGYSGFTDQSGTGILIPERVPCSLFIEESNRIDLDIVPIQKHRVDKRTRVTDNIRRKVIKMQTRRNRIAKDTVTRYDKKSTSDAASKVLNLILGAM